MKYIKSLFNKDDEIEKLELEDAINRLKRYAKRHKKNLCKIFFMFFYDNDNSN